MDSKQVNQTGKMEISLTRHVTQQAHTRVMVSIPHSTVAVGLTDIKLVLMVAQDKVTILIQDHRQYPQAVVHREMITAQDGMKARTKLQPIGILTNSL